MAIWWYRVTLNGKHKDDIPYGSVAGKTKAEREAEVRRDLIEHDHYDPRIIVVEDHRG